MNGFFRQLLLAAAIALLATAPSRSWEDKTPSKEKIDKLIQQLGSPKFSEREAASKALEAIGEPALDALREAAAKNKDIEIRRRAQRLVATVSDKMFDKMIDKMLGEGADANRIYDKMTEEGMAIEKLLVRMFREGVRQETVTRNLKRAYDFLSVTVDVASHRRYATKKTGDDPFLADAYIHLARTWRKMNRYDQAAREYQEALYFCNFDAGKRRGIGRECSEIVDVLVPEWKKVVKDKIDKDPSLKKLVAKYPFGPTSFEALRGRRTVPQMRLQFHP